MIKVKCITRNHYLRKQCEREAPEFLGEVAQAYVDTFKVTSAQQPWNKSDLAHLTVTDPNKIYW